MATMGNGQFGRLGHGWPCRSELAPRVCANLAHHDVDQVACGGAHTVALAADGSVFTFGMNQQGQLGHSEDDQLVPVRGVTPSSALLCALL